MKDIATATGVSRSTVSRILNDAPLTVPIAAATRERVLAASRALGYRPNPLARSLRGAPTMLLGAIVRDITDPFFAGAIEAVSVEARKLGYNIVLGHAHAQATEAHALATMLEARQCDAILLLGDMGDQPRLLDDLRDTHVPVVALWQGSELDLIPAVNVDNQSGIATAIDHLRDLGHRRIAFIGGRLLGDIRERQAAYAEAMVDLLGEVPAGYIQHVANTPADGEAALRALMGLSPRRDRHRRVDRRPGPRGPPGCPRHGHAGPGGALGRGLRRHPDGDLHRAGADDRAHADGRDGRRGDHAGGGRGRR